MHFQVSALSKAFDGHAALDRISFAVGERDFVCLLGPSGCGKTTLLRIVAGLLAADSGTLSLGGRDLTAVSARARGFGMVFQAYSLFPDMSVAQNVGYGMKIRGAPARAITARVDELLRLVQLPQLGDRYPAQLSGGQQQRVALARALAVSPSLLLLDEPLSALDAKVRVQIRQDIHRLQRRLGIPTLMVTHDQEEALSLADTIICMDQGRIVQIGAPRELYTKPATRFVAGFIGLSNLLPTAWVREALPALLRDRPHGGDEAFEACVRPEDIRLDQAPRGEGEAQVEEVSFLGNVVRLAVRWRGSRLLAEQPGGCALRPGDSVRVDVAAGRCAWVAA